MTAEANFVRQQGFRDASPEACAYQYPALMWQPRAIGSLVLVGLGVPSLALFSRSVGAPLVERGLATSQSL
jgi:hypothetical protein